MFHLGYPEPSEGVGPSMCASPPEFLISVQEVPVFLDSLSEFPEQAWEGILRIIQYALSLSK